MPGDFPQKKKGKNGILCRLAQFLLVEMALGGRVVLERGLGEHGRISFSLVALK